MSRERINWARREREALCDLFDEVGPATATLCEGWTTADLAAHLVVRESRPDAAAGILIAPLAAHGEKVRRHVAARPWSELVDEVRSGPPHWSPMRIEALDRATNTTEFFVHHEDVRRARAVWTPRLLDDEFDRELVAALRRGIRLTMRRAPSGVVLDIDGHETLTAKKGEPSVTVSGAAGEIVLFCFGRQAHADVELSGDAATVDRLRSAHLGI